MYICIFRFVLVTGAGTFGTVRAGIYKPKNGGPEVECAIKVLKPADELPNQKVILLLDAVHVGPFMMYAYLSF